MQEIYREPPTQPGSRDAAFARMRNFISLINKGDAGKARGYVCDTLQRAVIEAIVESAVSYEARLAVTPRAGPESSSSYTGSITGHAQLTLAVRVKGSATISHTFSGTYCIEHLELQYSP